uniref:alanine racemase n=1 Tax=Actinotalea sp. C106 TaxID=2908644 RepID=UPI002028535B
MAPRDGRLSAVTYPARAVVDLDAISANVTALADRAGPAAVMAVVKADAYGHGLVPSARAALAGGATWLGAAQVEVGS